MKKFTLTFLIVLASISWVFSQAQPGNCLHFDGINDNVRRAVLSVNTNSVSVGIRLNVTGTLSTNQYLFYNGSSTTNGFGMMIPSGSTSVTIIYGGLSSIATGFTLSPNVWTLLSLTISNNQLRFFVNGTQSFSTTTASAPNAASTGSFSIGSDDSGNQNYLGLIEEFRFWNRTICPAAVAFRANCQLNVTEPSLIAYYPFNQGLASAPNPTVTSLLDATANAVHAALFNFSLTGTASNWLSTTGALTTFCGIAPPNATIVPSTSAICNGASATFTVNGINTFSWSNGSTAASIVVSPSVNSTYSVIGLDNVSGCIFMGSNTLAVNPTPSLTLASSNPSICPNSSVILTASGANTFTWNNNASTSTIVVTPSVTVNYSVTGTNSFGCQNFASIGIMVYLAPIINIIASSASVCPNASVSLTATGGISYNWGPGSTNSTIAINPTVSATYSVIGTTTFGCQKSASVTISVFPKPTLSLSVNNPSICAGNSVLLTSSGAQTFSWSTASTSNSILVTPTVTTSYSVTGTNTFGCKDLASTSITVFALPSVSTSVNRSSICVKESETITANGATSYSWSTGASGAQVVISPTVNAVYSYTVIGTNTNNCNASAVQTVSVGLCTDLETISGRSINVKAYPNPNNGSFYIELNAACYLSVKNQLGQELLSKNMHEGINEIDLQNFPSGIYLVSIQQPNLNKTLKIVKQ